MKRTTNSRLFEPLGFMPTKKSKIIPSALGLRQLKEQEERNNNILTGKTTEVVFRKIHGEVIALFPYSNFDSVGNVDSFMSISGMRKSNVYLTMRNSTPATPEEYVQLIEQLESEPYNMRLNIQ